MIFGKLVAGLLGLLAGGVPGAIFGLVLGHLFDLGLSSVLGVGGAGAAAVREAFLRAIFLLMGHIAKADGRVSEDEVAHTEAMFRQLGLGDEQRHLAILMFKEGSQDGFSAEMAISAFLESSGGHPVLKRTLLMFLVATAMSDGDLHEAERNALLRIGALLGYPQAAIEELLRMATAQENFHSHGGGASGPIATLDDAYAALGVVETGTDAQVKRAYRKLMSQNHPDKLASKGVPEEMMRLATEKSQEIQAAYELVRKSRGNPR